MNINIVDKFLDQISMYRLVLYSLIFFVVVASVLGFFNLVPFSAFQILTSAVFLIVVCWSANKTISWFLNYPVAIESSYITALILALIVNPAQSLQNYFLLFVIGFLAIASKYLFALNKRHILNPAAIAVVLSSLIFNESASWWVGTAWMIPITLICGLLIIRKLQFEKLVGSYLITSIVLFTSFVFINNQNYITGFTQLFINSSFLFFAFIMLTEPATLPPTKYQRIFYGALIGFLSLPQIHFGSIYLTPELALVIGNIYSFVVGPRQNLILKLKNMKIIANDILEFSFEKNNNFNYLPGQYMEWTLPHKTTDSRGNRRYFTLSSSPTEPTVDIGVKFYDNGSSYKKFLRELTNNLALKAGSLAGDFILPKDKNKKIVFIAGGIGVTPFRSMIKYLMDKNEKRDVVLFYSNTYENEIAYREIFDQAKAFGIKIVYFLTGDSIPDSWSGRTGRANKDAIISEVPDYKERIFYISGSLPFINGIKKTLGEVGIGRNNIKTDFFPGYV